MLRSSSTPEQKETAREILRNARLPRDALPYTKEFDRLLRLYQGSTQAKPQHHDFWQLLCRAAKEGGAKCRAKAPQPPRITQQEAVEIIRLFPRGMGARDSLPYTPDFEAMRLRFNKATEKSLGQASFWRAIARVAKSNRRPKPVQVGRTTGDLTKEIVDRLHSMNPCWKGELGPKQPPNKRHLFRSIVGQLTDSSSPSLMLRGPRQVGKTTLQLQVIEALLQTKQAVPKQLLRVQMDELPSFRAMKEPVLEIARWFERNILRESMNEAARHAHQAYLFFDEAQNIKAWDAQFKFLLDHHACRIFVTGSSSLRMHLGRRSLAGRAEYMEFGPLRLCEVATIRGHFMDPFQEVVDQSEWLNSEFWETLSRYDGRGPLWHDSMFEKFCELGGYPRCHKDLDYDWTKASKYLRTDIVEKTFAEDLASEDRRIGADVVKEVLRLLLRYAGQAPKIETLSQQLSERLGEAVSPKIMRDCISGLEDAMLVCLIEPLQMRLRKQTAAPKICLCDHAIRAAYLQEKVDLCGEEAENSGHGALVGRIMESVVGRFLAGFEGINLAHLPASHDQDEIDYVITIGDRRIPVEVKYKHHAWGETGPLQQFLRKPINRAPFGILVTREDTGKQDGIIGVPAKNLLLLA